MPEHVFRSVEKGQLILPSEEESLGSSSYEKTLLNANGGRVATILVELGESARVNTGSEENPNFLEARILKRLIIKNPHTQKELDVLSFIKNEGNYLLSSCP